MTLDRIVEALRIERELRGWSYRDVEKAGGPSASMIWYYERSEKRPSVDRLSAWALALGYELKVDLAIKTVGGVMAEDRLYGKFRVERVDGRDKPGCDKADARYFVLDWVHDPYSRVALAAYADSCEAELPGLAADLRAALAEGRQR